MKLILERDWTSYRPFSPTFLFSEMATAKRTAGLAPDRFNDKCQCVFGVCRIPMTTVNGLPLYFVPLRTSTSNLVEK
jgi:hypothetical protein